MKQAKVALITGITGQDGSYLAELLIEKGYEVHGIVRRSSLINTHRIDQIYGMIHLHYGDLTDATNLISVIKKVEPNEIYNLGAQSHVKVSFEVPEYTGQVDGLGTLRILEAVRLLGMQDDVRIYQASTSELYGLVQAVPQTETTPFYPRSPYGVAKLYGFWIVKNYRESYGMHCSSGILFNHESPRRGETFVTRKITRGLSQISVGLQDCLYLGNLDAAQLLQTMSNELGDIDEIIKSGDWSSMLAWLRDKIHLKGSVMTPAELIESATGSPPSPEPFLAYVEAKYSKLYNL